MMSVSPATTPTVRAALVVASLLALARSPAGAQTPKKNADAALYATAAQRIEQNRKAGAVVLVVDAQGRPVPDAKVAVEQQSHAFRFGCNLFLWGTAGSPADEAAYRDRFAAVFNFATLGFYWPSYEPRPGQTLEAERRAAAAWCRDHGLTPKGHPLAWNFADPRWLPADPAGVLALQYARIDRDVAAFRGLIDVWDVVNEPTHYEREAFRERAPKLTAAWDSAGRVPFLLECLKHARAANPDATLLVNDYRNDDPYAKVLDELIAANGGTRPFDAIGLQSHMHGGAWTNRRIWETCERFARFGVPLHFTETTILSGEPGYELAEREKRAWPSTPEGEARQADEVERFYTMVFSHPSVEAITWWDFADRRAWQRAPAGFLREDLSPKPAYDRLRELVKERWWTRAEPTTDEAGQARFRGFLGTYRVTVTAAGRTAAADLVLAKGRDNRLTVTLP